MRRALAAAAAALLIALPSAGCSAEPPADKAFGERVRAYLLAHPEVLREALTALDAKETAAAASAATQAIADNRAAIERDARDPVGGAAVGKVTVTEFFDYRCPYCKVAGPLLPTWLAKHPNVRFVYKEFPILSPASEEAARLALAAKLQGRYEPVHQALMSAQALTPAAADEILRKAGVDVAKARTDAASPAIAKQIEDIHALARTLGVNGTPAFVVGDHISNGWAPEELDGFVAEAARAKAGG